MERVGVYESQGEEERNEISGEDDHEGILDGLAKRSIQNHPNHPGCTNVIWCDFRHFSNLTS